MKRKRPLVLPSKNPAKVTPLASAQIDWNWKEHLLQQGMPAADIPKDLAKLKPVCFNATFCRSTAGATDSRAPIVQPKESQELMTAFYAQK